MEKFVLKSITIEDEQENNRFRKTLSPGTYKLADENAFQMYGHNISVCAIVGKNGAGKTSLLDIFFRIINNFSFVVIGQVIERNAADKLFFIPGLYASFDYSVNGKECKIICRGDTIAFECGNTKWYISRMDMRDGWFESRGYKYRASFNRKGLKEILNDCFFTIVVNYSLQAFNSFDYKSDREGDFWQGPGGMVYKSNGIWIDSMFHKNDGYLVPLTLNPYRNQGRFDLQSETERTISRLSAILIQAQRNSRQVLEGYQLQEIRYTFNRDAVADRLERCRPKNREITGSIYQLLPSLIETSINTEDNILGLILEYYGINPSLDKTYCLHTYAYIGYKILSIAKKYPSYENFSSLGNSWKIFDRADEHEKKLLKELVGEIKKDKSHITTKVHQAKQFIENLKDNELAYIFDRQDFTFEEYERFVSRNNIKDHSLEGYIGMLPPPIFKAQILLQSSNIEEGNNGYDISLEQLSSGERQFLFMMSTLIYHILNIKSVPAYRIHYRNINLILDEVEICFHPEYQRLLVYRLVSTIQRLRLNTFCSFNIIMTTHSPFILSDIVPENILYLKKGQVANDEVEKKLPTPLAANVNDILKQSFFLEDGFIGEQAKKMILEVVKFLQSNRLEDRDWNMDRAKEFIDRIGEPLLKEHLLELYKRRS